MGETKLWIDNTEPLYRRKRFMFCNLFLKHEKSIFDKTKAEKLFKYLTDEANKDYKKQIGEALPMADRKQAQKDLVEEFIDAMSIPAEKQFLKDDCAKTFGRREKVFRT